MGFIDMSATCFIASQFLEVLDGF